MSDKSVHDIMETMATDTMITTDRAKYTTEIMIFTSCDVTTGHQMCLALHYRQFGSTTVQYPVKWTSPLIIVSYNVSS